MGQALAESAIVEEMEGGLRFDANAPGDDTWSFDAFYQERYAPTVRLALLLVGSRETAEEVVQDAFIRLHPRFAELDRPGAYLRTAVVNGCHDRLRRRGRLQDRLPRLVSADSHEGGIDDVAIRDEMLAALRRLPFRTQAVLVLRYYGGLEQREIAEALDIEPSTVRGLASRGLQRLRADLDQEGGNR